MFGELDSAFAGGLLERIYQQARVNRGGKAACWTAPPDFIDRTSRQHKCRTTGGPEVSHFTARRHFISDAALQNDVIKVLDVFVPRNDTRGRGVVLEYDTG